MTAHITFYKNYFRLQNATFSRIEHEDTAVALVYKIIQPDGTQLILKICSRPQDYYRECYFLHFFANKIPVPRVIQTCEPRSEIPGALLMECLPGSVLKVADITKSLAYTMGSFLAKIHQNRTTGYANLFNPKTLISDPKVYFSQKFEERFSECKDHLPRTLLDQCMRYYKEHINLLEKVDGPCIIHGDFRPGNILACEDKLQGIIDWSSARSGFAEEDFCIMEHAQWSKNPRHKIDFHAGYSNIRPVPLYQTIMPLLRISRALDIIGFTLKRNSWQNTHKELYWLNLHFLEIFFGN